MTTRVRWTPQWLELHAEVIDTGLCTGCAACVIACPHDVIGYNHTEGGFKPFHLDDELGPGDCTHGVKGCTSCTRACPRFRAWETEADTFLFGRTRTEHELSGVIGDIVLARASDELIAETGQDGGVVSALLIWAIDNGIIECALVSHLEGDGTSWVGKPAVATNRDEILAGAGSRYTYSANTLAYDEAVERGFEKLGLVGMGCQTSAVPVMKSRKIGKVGRRMALTIGLLCSKSFDEAIFPELFEAKYGVARTDITKVNIKGVFQIWTRDGRYVEVPLKECYPWTREGCLTCPDFAAEHADISAGGIGKFADWTLTVVRTDVGREVLEGAIRDGVIVTRPADEDPDAIALMHRLARVSRRRWPDWAAHEPGVLPPKA